MGRSGAGGCDGGTAGMSESKSSPMDLLTVSLKIHLWEPVWIFFNFQRAATQWLWSAEIVRREAREDWERRKQGGDLWAA